MKALKAYCLYIGFAIALLPIYAHAGWTPPVRISDEAPSYAPRITANGDMVHVVYWTWSGTDRSYYLRSLDGGDLWEEPFRLGDSLIAGSEDSPVLRSVGDTIAAIWHQNLPGGGHYNLGFRSSANGGDTWGGGLHTFCPLIITNSKSIHFL